HEHMFASAIYDPVRDRIVIFGGFSSVGGNAGPPTNDVWALELGVANAPHWTPLTPAGTPPPARIRHRAIYDPVRDRMVVFSGAGGAQLDLAYRVTNALAGDRAVEWTVTSRRGWPGFPKHGVMVLAAASADSVRTRIAIPDTAVAGNALTFTVAYVGGWGYGD